MTLMELPKVPGLPWLQEEFTACVDALGECRGGGDRLPPEAQLAVDRNLDAIFLTRIGMRFLLEHYVATAKANPNPCRRA